MATGDLIDDIQDDETPVPDDRHSVGRVLETVSNLLMLCYASFGRLADRGVSAPRIVSAMRIFGLSGVDALKGQNHDMGLELRRDVSMEESLNASRLKSASLTRCAAGVGASLGTDNAAEIDLYAQFGWHYGLAAQLMNDIAAIWPGTTGKSDLRLGKKTLPIAFALNLPKQSSVHARRVQAYYDSNGSSRPSEGELKWSLWRCGAIHYTWIVAARERARAERICRTLSGGSLNLPMGRLLT